MIRIGEWLRRIWYLLNRGRLEAALREEMDAHRAMMGEPTRFGNTLQLREQSRDVWGWAWLDALVRDLRFAARGLRRTPVFTLVAIVSLALGLALTTTTVSVVNAYLIRSLPYPDGESPVPRQVRAARSVGAARDDRARLDVGRGCRRVPHRRVRRVVLSERRRLYAVAARPAGHARIRGRPGRVRRRRAAIHRAGLRRRIRTGRAHRARTVARSVRIGSWRDRAPDSQRSRSPARDSPRRSGSSACSHPASTSVATAERVSICWFPTRLRCALTWSACAMESRLRRPSAASPKQRGVRRRRRFRMTGPACSSSPRTTAGLATFARSCSASRSP